MKKLLYLFLLLAFSFLLLAFSCKGPETITVTNTVVRDTTIYIPIPGERVHDSIKVPYFAQFSTPKNVLETKHALSTAWIENSLLQHTLIQKQSNMPATIPGAIRERTVTVEKQTKVPYPVEKIVKAPLNWFQKFLMYTGGLTWMAAIGFALFKIRRLVMPI